MEKPFWINSLIDSSYQLFANHDPASHLPFDAWGLHPLYNDLWLEKIYEMVKRFNAKGLKIEEHLDFFPNLSSSRFLVLMNMIHYQTSNLDEPKLITAIEDFLVRSIELRAKEDLFAYDKNIELTNDEVDKLINDRLPIGASFEESREIGKILVALASLTHGLYNDWCTDYDYEISGPYYKDQEMILFRSFPDLCPKDLWSELKWDFKKVSIITTYKNLQAKIAFVGCHITYTDSTINNLSGYDILLDDKPLQGIDNLRSFREKIMPYAAEQFEDFLNMDFESQKIKFVYQEHYQYKKLFDLVGMDWQPIQEILQRIKNKELIKDIFPSYDMTKEKYAEIFGANKLIKAYNIIKE